MSSGKYLVDYNPDLRFYPIVVNDILPFEFNAKS